MTAVVLDILFKDAYVQAALEDKGKVFFYFSGVRWFLFVTQHNKDYFRAASWKYWDFLRLQFPSGCEALRGNGTWCEHDYLAGFCTKNDRNLCLWSRRFRSPGNMQMPAVEALFESLASRINSQTPSSVIFQDDMQSSGIFVRLLLVLDIHTVIPLLAFLSSKHEIISWMSPF